MSEDYACVWWLPPCYQWALVPATLASWSSLPRHRLLLTRRCHHLGYRHQAYVHKILTGRGPSTLILRHSAGRRSSLPGVRECVTTSS